MKITLKWLTTALLLLITTTIQAQPEWQWGKRGGSAGSSGGNEQVMGMATDPNGNVYVLALNNHGSPANVDGHPGISIWDRVSVASWNCNGEFRWMKTFGSEISARGAAIGTDSLGGIYICGTISNEIGPSTSPSYFDTDSVLSFTKKNIFLIKYDTSGNFQWLKMPEADTITQSWGGTFDMDVSPVGDLYLYSLLRPGSLDGGAFIVPDTGMYVWKTDKDGVFQSLTKLDITVSGTPSHGYGYGNLSPIQSHFRRDRYSGRYYISGWPNADFGTLMFGSTSTIAHSMYVAAFSKDGTSLWTKLQDSTGYNLGIENKVVTDAMGNVYASGDAGPGSSFSGHVFINAMGGSAMPILIALDSNGTFKYATSGNTSSLTTVKASVLSNNIIALAGKHNTLQWQDITVTTPVGLGYVYLARFNAVNGTILDINSIPTYGLTNFGTAMAADKNGNLYVGGRFDNALFVAEDTLFKTGGSYDWFIAKFGTANCDCTIPTANFSYAASGTAINFSYTGSTDYTSISWDFGDGTTATTANPTHTFSDTASHTVCVTVTNDCGSNVYCIEVSAPTGIEATSAAAVKVYPNPTTNSIIVEGAGSGTKLLLYEVTGKLALEQTLRNSRAVNLNISHLPDGIYLLQFTDSKGRKGMTKVVKR